MMTLKQAFTVAAVQQTAKAPAQLCEGCPLQGLHKLCERIEGEPGRGGVGRSSGSWANSLEGSVPRRPMLVTGVMDGCLLYKPLEVLGGHEEPTSSRPAGCWSVGIEGALGALPPKMAPLLSPDVSSPQGRLGGLLCHLSYDP